MSLVSNCPLDREVYGLTRSTRDLLNIINRLKKKKVEFVVLDQQKDKSTAIGRLMVSMLAAIAEFENDLRKALNEIL